MRKKHSSEKEANLCLNCGKKQQTCVVHRISEPEAAPHAIILCYVIV